MKKYYLTLLAALILNTPGAMAERMIEIKDSQLVVDNEKQPQLFGAEVQYFRLRGGYGPNVPREKVIELWNKALDKVVEAHMNAVSFYIPWDFHEYAEGKFDFTGTADEDGDGKPDYPSRDVITFIKLIKQHGIKHILVRPGPYVNAEWGFLGFGAIPEWFHDKYPESHMQTSYGWKTRLYDYHNPDLLAKTQIWFTNLYNQVLKDNIGVGQPINFVQIDNETNYLWQTIYNHDYSPNAVAMYQAFLKARYNNDITKLNAAHQRSWSDWSTIRPPTQFGQNLGEDQDWYRYHDSSIHDYLTKIRRMWEALGVKEPQIMFTLAESYNAADQGLLPNYIYRNDPGNTGLMTVNLYPKTYETADKALANNPFKADLDVKAADEANDYYIGSHQEWAMGPEIQAGWWRGIDVSPASRQQTYLTVLGHGLKSFFLYYFNEGNNFGSEWAPDHIRPLYTALRKEQNIDDSTPASDLSDAFWGALQARSDQNLVLGFDVRTLMQTDAQTLQTLYFDSPLDGDANPRPHYDDLKKIGERVIAPYQDFLGRSLEAQDSVGFVKDTENHVPSPQRDINNIWASADWSAGLLGYLLNANVNPHILIGELSPESDFQQNVLVHVDTGLNATRSLSLLQKAIQGGRGVINLLGNQVPVTLGFGSITMQRLNIPNPSSTGRETLTFYTDASGNLKSAAGTGITAQQITSNQPIFAYDKTSVIAQGCEPILYWNDQVVGYRCVKNGAGQFTQIGALIFDDFNSSDYANMTDPAARRAFMVAVLKDFKVASNLRYSDNALRTVAFARKDPAHKLLWITTKTGTRQNQSLRLQVSGNLLDELASPASALATTSTEALFRIKNLLGDGKDLVLSRSTLTTTGFPVTLQADDSTVFVVERAN